MRTIAIGACPQDILDRYLRAGDALAAYLLLDWPDGVLPDARQRWWLAETRREMLTLALWCAARPGRAAPAIDTARVRRWLGVPAAGAAAATSARSWVEDTTLSGNLDPELAKYREFLEFTFESALAALERRPPCADVWHLMGRLQLLFEGVQSEQGSGPREYLTETCATTWLALSSAMPDRVRRDIWLALRESQKADRRIARRLLPGNGFHPDVPAPLAEQAAGDPAARCAEAELRGLYRRWHASLPSGWAAGFQRSLDEMPED
jgi:hypothetical protein